MRSGLLLLLLVLTGAAVAASVGDAPDRPAMMTRQAEHAVLIGAALAGDRIVAVGERGIIMVSDDGGKTWKQATVPVSVTLNAVRFADATNGIAVGHGGMVLTTSDGGTTWTRRVDGKRMAQLALEVAQANGNPTALAEAQRLVADGPDKPLFDALVFDARRALVVGAYGLAYATDDGGLTWKPWMDRLDNPKTLHLYAVRARGESILIAGEQGLVFRSDDRGKTFKRIETPYKGSYFTAELLSSNEIILAGLRGNVWRSINGGAHWSRISLPAPVSITGSAVRADGSFLLINQTGAIFRSNAAGVASLTTSPLPQSNAVLPLPNGSMLVLTVRGPILVPAPSFN